jgi:adenylate cyclase
MDGSEAIDFVISTDQTTIGRTRANACALRDQASSSRHAVIRRNSGGWQIEDVGSRNGTFVNGVSITLCVLKHGDRIQIGDTELVFEEDAAPLVISGDDDPDHGTEDVLVSLNLKSHSDLNIGGGPAAAVTDQRVRLAEEKLRLIGLVSEKLVRIQDDRKLAAEILTLVIGQLRADRGFICMLDEQRSPVPLATFGLPPGEPPRASRTVLRRIMDEKQAVVIKPSQSSEIISLVQSGVASTMYVPLWTGDDIIGFLSIDLTTPGRSFSETDVSVVLTIAHQAAVGLERTRLARVAEKDRQMRSYLSKYLDEKIVRTLTQAGGDADPLAPQEREVTVLFSDIVSFTKMSEGLPPSQIAQFIRDYLTAMTDIIFSHGGTIDKYIGDAVMALFGAPIESREAPALAIRAALAMRDAVSRMTPPKPDIGSLRVRFGINTGVLTVGNLGSARRMEYTALGDSVNVASRLQTFARPNEIVISEMTLAKPGVQACFDVEEIGHIDVKNRAQPVSVFKVIRDRGTQTSLG